MSSDRDKDMKSRYCSAEAAAWSFQSTLTVSTAAVASLFEKPSYSNWSINPVRENAETSR